MKKVLCIFAIAILSGCASGIKTNVSMNWPDVPADLKNECPDLSSVDPKTTKLSEVLTVVSSNYSEYYSCKDRVNNWIEWYNTQQKIYNSVK
jgi:hypothetical protein